MSLRARYGAIIAQAAENGYRDADALWACTPAEAAQRLSAFSREAKNRQTQAWLIGAYVACAARSPAQYPPCPQKARMSDQQMRRTMKAFATGKGDE